MNIIIIIIIIPFNSIYIYLRANLAPQRAITKWALKKKKYTNEIQIETVIV
jgi:hypothetical protein